MPQPLSVTSKQERNGPVVSRERQIRPGNIRRSKQPSIVPSWTNGVSGVGGQVHDDLMESGWGRWPQTEDQERSCADLNPGGRVAQISFTASATQVRSAKPHASCLVAG